MEPMVTQKVTTKQVLEFIILGIKNKQYQEVIDLAQECINQIDAKEEGDTDLSRTHL